MDWFVTLLGTLAWPLSTFLIALMFREDVRKAMGRVGQVKYRDLELTFRADLQQAESLARTIPAQPLKSSIVLEVNANSEEPKSLGGHLIGINESPAVIEGREALEKLAARSPRRAVEGAWEVAGQALVRTAQALADRRTTTVTNPEAAIRFLVDRGWLTGPEAMLVGLLRSLKDRAARVDEAAPSPEEARRFVDLALGVAARIEARG